MGNHLKFNYIQEAGCTRGLKIAKKMKELFLLRRQRVQVHSYQLGRFSFALVSTTKSDTERMRVPCWNREIV